jgi:hypothetical protein
MLFYARSEGTVRHRIMSLPPATSPYQCSLPFDGDVSEKLTHGIVVVYDS